MEAVDTLTANTATPHVEAICACLDRLGGTMARLPSMGVALPGASPALAFNGRGALAVSAGGRGEGVAAVVLAGQCAG